MKTLSYLILFFISFNSLSNGITIIDSPLSHNTINAGAGNDIMIGSDYPKQIISNTYNGQSDDDIIIGCSSGGELNGDSGNDILSVFYFSCILSIYENLSKNSSINLLTNTKEKTKIIEKDNYFLNIQENYLKQIVDNIFLYNTDYIYISILNNKTNKQKIISLTNFLTNDYFFKPYLFKYQTLSIMRGGSGDDFYLGSSQQEKIIYDSGIDTIYLGNTGFNDSIVCNPKFEVLRSYNDIIIFYNFNNMVLLKNSFKLDYSLKNICGKSLLTIFNESYILK